MSLRAPIPYERDYIMVVFKAILYRRELHTYMTLDYAAIRSEGGLHYDRFRA